MPEYLPKRSRVGGLRLEARKDAPTRAPIRPAFIPSRLWIPVEESAAGIATICVEVGERVLKGQTIAAGAGFCPSVHASSSGRVAAIERRDVVTAGILGNALCIAVEVDGKDTPVASTGPPLEEKDRVAAICRAGIVGLGGAAFSTAHKIAQTRPSGTVVINGAECEPYISCDDMLMREHAPDVIAGSLALCDLVGAASCIIAIERDKPQAILAMKQAAIAAGDPRLGIAEIPSIYPAGGERQLIELLCAVEIPSQSYPSDMGFLCQNVGTAYAVERALTHAAPMISRIVTVTGGGVADPANVDVLIGTPIEDLIEYCGGYTDAAQRLIIGGSMMGVSIPSDAVPVSKSTNCVLAASTSEAPAPGNEWPCIRCGECASACPAYLLPQSLLVAARADADERLGTLGLMDCIECGCCDAVCPSHIRLTETFRDAKRGHLAWIARRTLAEDAERRFEARARRLEEDRDAEREAQKRLIERLDEREGERRRSIEAAVARAREKHSHKDGEP